MVFFLSSRKLSFLFVSTCRELFHLNRWLKVCVFQRLSTVSLSCWSIATVVKDGLSSWNENSSTSFNVARSRRRIILTSSRARSAYYYLFSPALIQLLHECNETVTISTYVWWSSQSHKKKSGESVRISWVNTKIFVEGYSKKVCFFNHERTLIFRVEREHDCRCCGMTFSHNFQSSPPLVRRLQFDIGSSQKKKFTCLHLYE